MSYKLKRTYTDVHGVQRTLIHIETLEGLVGYRKTENGTVYSGASRWYLEDGSIVQIPEDVFSYQGITFKDEYIYE